MASIWILNLFSYGRLIQQVYFTTDEKAVAAARAQTVYGGSAVTIVRVDLDPEVNMEMVEPRPPADTRPTGE